MKKIALILLVFVLIVTGCSKSEETTKTKEPSTENSTEVESDQNENQSKEENEETTEQIEETADKVDERLKNFQAIKEYLIGDDVFPMSYQEMQGEPLNFDNYKMHHIDFNKDGVLDTVISTWSIEGDYRNIIFITLEDNNYKYYISNLRASHDSTFDVEDGFIIEESKGYKRIAYLMDIPNAPIIRSTYASYKIPETIEVSNEYNPDMKFKTIHSLEKIEGLKEFEEQIKKFYYDENEKEHLVWHIILHKKFNEETMEYESTEKIVVEDITAKTISENLIIGNKSDLKTFENVLNDSNDFKTAIDYYYENRKAFSKNSRIKYIDDVLEYISSFTLYNDNIFVTESNVETVFDASIANVNIWGDNPVPENARDLFKLAKYFYIEDGETLDRDIHLEEGSYRLTCVDDVYTNKIRGLKFDKSLLEDNYDGYISRDDEYIDVKFKNREQVLEDVYDIVYPTILINNLSQLNEFKNSNLWKTNIVIVPEKVTFIPYGTEDCEPQTLDMFENETLYSEDKEVNIDYANYNLVVIPQQKSINEQSLSLKEINITETGSEMAHSFIVLGMLEDVKLTYTSNALDENAKPIEKEIGTISNEKVIVNVAMPTDFSVVKVEGKWFYDMGDFEEISFSLDDSRDPESYPLILKNINNQN